MPRGKRDETSQSRDELSQKSSNVVENSRNWQGFINIELSPDEKAFFPQWWQENADDIWDELQEIINSGLKFSLALDAQNDCYIASLTGNGVLKFPKFVCAMSARTDALDKAIALLVYKHVVICDGDWSKYWTAKRKFGSEI